MTVNLCGLRKSWVIFKSIRQALESQVECKFTRRAQVGGFFQKSIRQALEIHFQKPWTNSVPIFGPWGAGLDFRSGALAVKILDRILMVSGPNCQNPMWDFDGFRLRRSKSQVEFSWFRAPAVKIPSGNLGEPSGVGSRTLPLFRPCMRTLLSRA